MHSLEAGKRKLRQFIRLMMHNNYNHVLCAVATLGLLGATACERSAVFSRRPPVAEFLLAAGDSTYWVRSSAEGVRVRSAPILLTEVDGHLYEVFINDDVHEFTEASFVSARVFRRDIMEDDSLLIVSDSTVAQEWRSWVRTHPMAMPRDMADDDESDAPATVVSDEFEILDVHGPWLTYAYTLDVDISGRDTHLHRRRQGVVDVRNGKRATVRALFGDAEASRLQELGRRTFADLSDSVRNSTDERSTAARRTLPSFLFDTTSFALKDVSRAPAVSFLVSGTSDEGDALTLVLPPLVAAAPEWWTAIVRTLPQWNIDSTQLEWERPGYHVLAHPTADGEALVIEMVDHSQSGGTRTWSIATVPAPAYQLIALDDAPLDSIVRNRLARAFDQSTALNGNSQQASVTSRWQPRLLLRAVNRRTTRYSPYDGNPCCRDTRRVCSDARAKFSPLHYLPARIDTRHPDSGHRCRVASL